MKGRTIKVFLADGVPDGLRTAEIMNWTGKMLVFPQSQLADFLGRAEAKRTGIYILAGDDPNDPSKERVYIGESDDVYERLKQHAKDVNKDFWSRTVVVVSKDENLSKAHVRYLESRLIALTAQAKRAVMANGNSGAPVSLAESDIACF
jgi:predicted GIY-YIG superfamily endonuclease